MNGSDFLFIAPPDNNQRTITIKVGRGALQRIIVGQGTLFIELFDGPLPIAKLNISSGSFPVREFGIAFSQDLTAIFQVATGNSDNFTVVFD